MCIYIKSVLICQNSIFTFFKHNWMCLVLSKVVFLNCTAHLTFCRLCCLPLSVIYAIDLFMIIKCGHDYGVSGVMWEHFGYDITEDKTVDKRSGILFCLLRKMRLPHKSKVPCQLVSQRAAETQQMNETTDLGRSSELGYIGCIWINLNE